MSRTWKIILLALAGGLAWRWATHPMGLKLALWQRAWSRRYGPVEGRKLSARVRWRYDMLRADCPYQPDPTLRRHLDDHILPGLALYQVIMNEKTGEDRDLAFQETGQLFRAAAATYLLPGRRLHLAFDARCCFYQDTLRRYDAAELALLFCQFNDGIMAKLPASIQ
jgi:hypothetical protein